MKIKGGMKIMPPSYLTRKMRLENKEVYAMSDKPASDKGILRKSDKETTPGNSI